jgi:hypothetical protein
VSFRTDNQKYEEWLREQCAVVEKDLHRKHKRMKKNPFVFLRATFFRWALRIEKVCSELSLADAPKVLSVGDVHVENYGTWRDADGRLVWGINDFDEAADIAWPFDLVRLATSALLIPKSDLTLPQIAEAILSGYSKGLAKKRPTLLDEHAASIRKVVARIEAERNSFWHEVERYCPAKPPQVVISGLKRSLPKGAEVFRFATRVAGGGSLGRPRFVAVACWQGGRLVREGKAWVPSAWDWAHRKIPSEPRYLGLARGEYRSPDPFLDVHDKFIFRRLAADSRKIELGDNPAVSAELLKAMGFDLGAIHAADPRGSRIPDDLGRRSPDWLRTAAKAAAAAVRADYSEWNS